MSPAEKRTLAALRRRLERMELEHLRAHALELHERLERTEADLARAEDLVEWWHDQATNLMAAEMDDEHATHRCVGMNKAGELMVVRLDA